jgi:hypothetical protein
MELKKDIKYYPAGEIHSIKLLDERGFAQGEYVEYSVNGNIYRKGFSKDSWFIGKYYVGKKYQFNSLMEEKFSISESEHKKELAMIRLGLIEEPIEFSYLLKDYDENGKIK